MNIKDYYIDFFISKGHKQIPSAPIIPENDPTCLFNTAGMQPLVPYLKGETHPLGTKLVDYQKCFRTNDLEEVGDKTHHTFFEMLGNWSLGDYFKKESIAWSFEFLTEVLHLPLEKLAVTVFSGNEMVEKDEETASLWNQLGIKKERIAYLKEDNWWPNMEAFGPCGPDSEIFYWRSKEAMPVVFDPEDSRWVEIWNNVFMQYNHKEDGTFEPLKNQNVDTGMGVERVTAILENVDDNYKTSLFLPAIHLLEQFSGLSYQENERSMRIIADHIRAITIISGEDSAIKPSNTDQGYLLRRLIRRVLRHAKKLNIDLNSDFDLQIADQFILQYQKYYPELVKNKAAIHEVLTSEKLKFGRTLEKGLKEFDRLITSKEGKTISGEEAFHLYDTYGFPIELTEELALEQQFQVDVAGFQICFKDHQEKSRLGASEKFKGGLSSTSDKNVKYHTATHLLNAALKEVLGDHVHQKGSNITEDRMRFDFSHDQKMTPEEIAKAEALVNGYIDLSIPVQVLEMKKEEALASNAEAMFIDRYGDMVTVYQIGDVSKEVCGGPHVKNTKELGHFKIVKEEASSAGVRRIKATLE